MSNSRAKVKMSSGLEMSTGFHPGAVCPLCALVISPVMGWYHLSLPPSPLYTQDSHDYTSPDLCNNMPTGLPILILVSQKSILHTPARMVRKLAISIWNHLLGLLFCVVSLAPTPECKLHAHAPIISLRADPLATEGWGSFSPSSRFCPAVLFSFFQTVLF